MGDIRLSTAVVLGTDVVAALGPPDSPERSDFFQALHSVSDVRFLPRPYQRIVTLAVEELEERYPGQPRDELGRFSSDGQPSSKVDDLSPLIDAAIAFGDPKDWIWGLKSADEPGGNLAMAAIAALKGLDGLPRVVSKGQLDDLVGQGWKKLYRGQGSIEHNDAFREGPYRAGNGLYGCGTYFAVSDVQQTIGPYNEKTGFNDPLYVDLGYLDARRYADQASGTVLSGSVMVAALDPSARVVDYNDALDRKITDGLGSDAFLGGEQPKDNYGASERDEMEAAIRFGDVGMWAALNGYDAIEGIPGILLVLNRAKVAVAYEDVTTDEGHFLMGVDAQGNLLRTSAARYPGQPRDELGRFSEAGGASSGYDSVDVPIVVTAEDLGVVARYESTEYGGRGVVLSQGSIDSLREFGFQRLYWVGYRADGSSFQTFGMKERPTDFVSGYGGDSHDLAHEVGHAFEERYDLMDPDVTRGIGHFDPDKMKWVDAGPDLLGRGEYRQREWANPSERAADAFADYVQVPDRMTVESRAWVEARLREIPGWRDVVGALREKPSPLDWIGQGYVGKLKAERFSRYPGQPRDELGQWTSEGGSGAGDSDLYGERMEAEAIKRRETRAVIDQMAVDTYQSYGWLGINDPLRAGQDPPDDYLLEDGADYHETVDALDRLMTSEGGIPFDTVLYRGVSTPDVFPMDRDLTGTEFRDLGYLSTTANWQTAEAFSFPGDGKGGMIMVRLEVHKGDPGILAENEVIQPRGTRWRITGDTIRVAPGARTITMERMP